MAHPRHGNGAGPHQPPRAAERLLAAAVRDGLWRDSILGDLREEFAVVHRRHGGARARRWYWRHALAVAGRVMLSRAPRRQRETWIASSDPAPEGSGWRAGLGRDLRHAWRAVTRQPATSAVIVVTLALALATNSTTFAVADAIVIRPFRFPDVDRIVMVVSSDPNRGLLDRESVTAGDFRDWRRETRTIDHLSAAEWWDANLSGIEQPEQIPAFRVSPDFFKALAAPPVLGRDFLPDEETPGNHRRVVLGHGLWTRLFAADPGIVGKAIRVDGEPYQVVGVAGPGFSTPLGAQLWAPLAYSPADWTDRRSRSLMSFGRLRPDASLADAQADIGAIAERLRREYPDTNGTVPNGVVTFTVGMRDAGAGAFLMILVAAGGLLLLIACANIANLLLARGSERGHEFALRLALGGSRSRLALQLMLEAAMLTSIAIVLALPLAALGLALSRESIPVSVVRFVPGWQFLALSPTVFGVTAAFGALAVVLFALVPALQTVRVEVAETLRQGARSVTAPRRRAWLRNTLAAAQVALTLALLFGSWTLLQAADGAQNGPLGFEKRGLLAARIVLPDRPYADAERRRQFVDGVLDRLRSIPAVTQAAVVSNLPYSGNNSSRQFWPEGAALRESDVRSVDYRRVTTEYFETMRIPLLAGRNLGPQDRADTLDVALVSRSLADRYWPQGDALGRTFRVAADGTPITIVGIVGDVLHNWFEQRRTPAVYRPLAQDAPFAHAFVVRTVGDPTSVSGDLRRAVSSMDADQPILEMKPMAELVADRAAGLSYIAGMIAVVTIIALVLAVMGLYSLMAYFVSRRTPELGVRLALGATRWQIISLVTRHGLQIALLGLVAGTAVAFALGRVMESTLFGIVAVSAWQLPVLVAFVAAVSALASYIPARRTSRLDPTTALRSE